MTGVQTCALPISKSRICEATDAQILDLVQRVGSRFRWMHLEKLQEFDGAAGYTKAQGED